MRRYRSHSLRLVALAGVLMACGCGKKGPQLLKCYPVSGRVLIDGEPAVRAVVSLYPTEPQEDGKEYVGQTFTGDDGEFRMTTFTAGDGAPAGEYVVTIVANWVSRDGQDVGVPDLLQGRYADPKKSPLKVIVEAEPVVLDPFDLSPSTK